MADTDLIERLKARAKAIRHFSSGPTADQRLLNEAATVLSERDKRIAELEASLASEKRRSAELLKRLDKARDGTEPDYCYDPVEWDFTSSWDERDQVHGYGDGLPLGKIMQVATLIRGPRKWVANVPVTWDEDGIPDDTQIQWFDTEEEARAALSHKETGHGA